MFSYLSLEDLIGESIGLKGHKVVGLLAHTDVLYGQLQLVGNGKYYAAAGGTVQL